MRRKILGSIYCEVSENFMRGIYPISRTVKAGKHDLGVVEVEERRLGNIYGFDGGNYAGNVYDKEALSPTIRTYQGGNQQPIILENTTCKLDEISQKVHCGLCSHFMDDDCNLCGCSRYDGPVEIKESQIVAMRGRNPDNPSDRTAGIPTEQRLEPNSQGICNTLTCVQKDNVVLEETVIQIPRGYNKGACHKICPPITSHSFHENNLLRKQYRIRKLIPLECWRLMGFSDEDFHAAEKVNSNYQLYKQAGNSIVKDVLMAIFRQMMPERTQNK